LIKLCLLNVKELVQDSKDHINSCKLCIQKVQSSCIYVGQPWPFEFWSMFLKPSKIDTDFFLGIWLICLIGNGEKMSPECLFEVPFKFNDETCDKQHLNFYGSHNTTKKMVQIQNISNFPDCVLIWTR